MSVSTADSIFFFEERTGGSVDSAEASKDENKDVRPSWIILRGPLENNARPDLQSLMINVMCAQVGKKARVRLGLPSVRPPARAASKWTQWNESSDEKVTEMWDFTRAVEQSAYNYTINPSNAYWKGPNSVIEAILLSTHAQHEIQRTHGAHEIAPDLHLGRQWMSSIASAIAEKAKDKHGSQRASEAVESETCSHSRMPVWAFRTRCLKSIWLESRNRPTPEYPDRWDAKEEEEGILRLHTDRIWRDGELFSYDGNTFVVLTPSAFEVDSGARTASAFSNEAG